MKRILIAIAIFIAATPATAFAVDRDDDVTIDSRDEQFLYLIETAKYHFDALRNILNEIKRLYIS